MFYYRRHGRVYSSWGAMTETSRNKPMNQGLIAAKAARKDEFYTLYVDIQKEVEAYLEFDADTFRNKVVYCNCDDPYESNFFKFFAANFNRLGLKKLISTSYDGSPIAGAQLTFDEYLEGNGKRQKPKAISIEIEEVTDLDGDGAAGIEDVELFLKRNPHTRKRLAEGGDFRSAECVELLKQADIVVTNPPFSLFKEYVALLVVHRKNFLIIGNTNAITYKEIFPLIKANELWLGCTNFNVGMFFEVPDDWKRFHHIDKETGKKVARVSTSCWWTNLDHGRRHEPLSLMTMTDNLKFSGILRGKEAYDRYDNYDAIEVGTYKVIPSDYDGAMGVPITFLDKYCPEQFEILGLSRYMETDGMSREFVEAYYKSGQTGLISEGHPDLCYYDHDNKPVVPYMRILIRHRKQ